MANNALSHATSTTSPAKPSRQESAGSDAKGWARAFEDCASVSPKFLMVAATATVIARSVITVSAPLATDFSARKRVISRTSAKKTPAASVTHIGNAGECQSCSNDVAQVDAEVQVMLESYQTSPPYFMQFGIENRREDSLRALHGRPLRQSHAHP